MTKPNYAATAFADIMRLTLETGRVPTEIPEHYWRFCWGIHRHERGNKVPQVDIWSISRRSRPLTLPYSPSV